MCFFLSSEYGQTLSYNLKTPNPFIDFATRPQDLHLFYKSWIKYLAANGIQMKYTQQSISPGHYTEYIP